MKGWQWLYCVASSAAAVWTVSAVQVWTRLLRTSLYLVHCGLHPIKLARVGVEPAAARWLKDAHTLQLLHNETNDCEQRNNSILSRVLQENRTNRVCMCVCACACSGKLVHLTVEADQSQGMQSTRWRFKTSWCSHRLYRHGVGTWAWVLEL